MDHTSRQEGRYMNANLTRFSLLCILFTIPWVTVLPQEDPVADDEVILNTLNTNGATMHFVAEARVHDGILAGT